MSTSLRIAEVAALIGDPTRAALLECLIDGRAWTPGQLADLANVAPSTVSGHLAKLTEAGLVTCVSHGRRRDYRLASPEAAGLLEGLAVFTAHVARPAPRIPPALRAARSCYDHLAGQLGVALADALEARGAVAFADGGAAVTHAGRAFLAEIGVDIAAPSPTRRPECRACLDWSERRPHLAGRLGAALLEHALASGWVARAPEPRVIRVTLKGRAAFAETFGIEA